MFHFTRNDQRDLDMFHRTRRCNDSTIRRHTVNWITFRTTQWRRWYDHKVNKHNVLFTAPIQTRAPDRTFADLQPIQHRSKHTKWIIYDIIWHHDGTTILEKITRELVVRRAIEAPRSVDKRNWDPSILELRYLTIDIDFV